jgi:hypothetical protein
LIIEKKPCVSNAYLSSVMDWESPFCIDKKQSSGISFLFTMFLSVTKKGGKKPPF